MGNKQKKQTKNKKTKKHPRRLQRWTSSEVHQKQKNIRDDCKGGLRPKSTKNQTNFKFLKFHSFINLFNDARLLRPFKSTKRYIITFLIPKYKLTQLQN